MYYVLCQEISFRIIYIKRVELEFDTAFEMYDDIAYEISLLYIDI